MTICRSPLLSIPLVLVLCLASPAEEPKPKEAAAKPDSTAKPRPKITISKETTYITEPLRADGYVDYVAAINRRCSKGVTPENNAVIRLWQATGPKEIDKEIRTRYFEMLGIPELPENGEYLVSFDDFFQHKNGWKYHGGETDKDRELTEEAQKQCNQAESRPWSKEDFPILAELLETNEKALQILVDGSQHQRFYSPLIVKKGKVWEDCSAMGHALREAAHQLAQRSMLRLGQGQVAEAWQDALACHRWARLMNQEQFVVYRLVAMTCEGISIRPTVALAQYRTTTAEQARQWQSDLQNLPARGNLRESCDYGERLLELSHITDIALHGYPSPDALLCLKKRGLRDKDMARVMQSPTRLYSSDPRIDWDEAFLYCNAWLDRIVAACDKPTYAQRREVTNRIDVEGKTLDRQSHEQAPEEGPLSADLTPKMIARRLVDVRMGSEWGAIGAMLDAETKMQAYLNLECLTLALAAYRHDRGGYPKTLGELSPTWIAEIPKDPFADGDLHYKPEGDGYLIYSVGPNGKDDGGHNYWEEFAEICRSGRATTKEEESYDDIAICTPKKNSARK